MRGDRSDLLNRILRNGSQTGAEICVQLGLSRPTLTRLLADYDTVFPGFLCRIGAARSTRYAMAMPNPQRPGDPWRVQVYHVDQNGIIHRDGQIIVLHADEYQLVLEDAPSGVLETFPDGWVREHYEGVPWFLQDLRPQGYLGRALAHRMRADLGIMDRVHQWNDHQMLQVVTVAGEDLPGCFILGDMPAATAQSNWHAGNDFIRLEDRRFAYPARVRSLASGQWVPHSSAGGEQPKFVATVQDADGLSCPVIVKFSPEDDSASARRWRDLLIAEHHALSVLEEYRFSAARSTLIEGDDGRWFLESARFDRSHSTVHGDGRIPAFSLRTVAVEAFGDIPGWREASFRLGAMRVISQETRAQIELLDAYGHYIANTDRHAGNLTFLPDAEGRQRFTLAPVYDMLPMQYAPDAQGAMVPGLQAMAPYTYTDGVAIAKNMATIFWMRVAQDLRISTDFRSIAEQHVDLLLEASDTPDDVEFAGAPEENTDGDGVTHGPTGHSHLLTVR